MEEHDVPPNDGGIPDIEKDLIKEETIFDFETSYATVEIEKLEQFVENAFEKMMMQLQLSQKMSNKSQLEFPQFFHLIQVK